ncbi:MULTISPECIES: ribbon-helix-helix domain-containing protein [Mesorhizobium]|uniref:Aryl-sulfate sulfotransferase n=1 Tax=Mesorhizobium denitrificans TaxID=2294114 RepID=A0A371XG29_9HYPH|nr:MULTISPECIES: ribbon-helix-helix domain-containing protein [Mesorhizobium]RFC68192.1 aryl-sulfate sulfotransferase [Mesorhizobium denitrificans]
MSAVAKRSVSIRGHRTSFSVEQPFFEALQEIAAVRGQAFAALIAEIDETRSRDTNLSSAIRLYVLEYMRARQQAS